MAIDQTPSNFEDVVASARRGFACEPVVTAVGVASSIAVSDITIGLEHIAGFTPRPAGVGAAHGRTPAEVVVVGRTYQP